ncbi:PCYCGC motif-containing (lipo)protein [Paenibacillus sp. MBLB4367]|uniref:PCYCGC motif-containing (lipo)protein n=1 Tax=Paenibacillus sp. MBLB4367 TaxID=3384767 RepID=UPI0039083428
MSIRKLAVAQLGLALALGLSACGAAKQEASTAHAQHKLPNGDLQEQTASADKLPKFLDGQKEPIVAAYKIAAKNTDLLKWIPCYCGCGESANHKSNQNCFVKETLQDGSIVWDDHGTRCNVCINIAVTAVKMKEDGKSVKEIRTYIDQTYSKGYAAPTKTQMPS